MQYELLLCGVKIMEFDKLFKETNESAFAGLKLEDVNSGEIGWVHDWRKYIPNELRKDWDSLTERERQIIFVMAANQASAEEWD